MINQNVARLSTLSEDRQHFVRVNGSSTVCDSVRALLRERASSECTSTARLAIHFEKPKQTQPSIESVRLLREFMAGAPDLLSKAYERQVAEIQDGKRSFLGVPVLVLSGHTDSSGSDEYNYALSHIRALNAYRALGDVPLPLHVCAYGKSRLACNDSTGKESDAAAKAFNRRVEIDIALVPTAVEVVANPDELAAATIKSDRAESPSTN